MIAALVDIAWTAACVAGVAAAVGVCAVYCGLETSVYVMNKMRLDLRAEAGDKRAVRLRAMLGDSPAMLAVLLIGTNLANYVATFLVSLLFVRGRAGELAEWYTLAVVAPMLFIFADAVPKNVFQRQADTLSYRLVWVLSLSRRVFTACGLLPLVAGVSAALMRLVRRGNPAAGSPPAERMAVILAEGAASGLLTPFQSDMAGRTMNIANVTVAEAMIPMSHVVAAPAGAGVEQLNELIAAHDHARLPLVDEAGRIIAVVDTFEVLVGGAEALRAARSRTPLVLDDHLTVPEALYRIQRAKVVIAVVAAPDGRHVGIVTPNDLVDEIVGELAPE